MDPTEDMDTFQMSLIYKRLKQIEDKETKEIMNQEDLDSKEDLK